jgi:hypothetical protein
VPSAGNGSSAKARPAPSLKVVRAR